MRLTQESSAVQVGGGDGEMIAGDVGDKDASVAGFFFCHGSLKGSLKPASTEIAERRSRSVVMKGDRIAGVSGYTHVVELENCETLIHLPVKNPAEIMWDEMIPFKSHADRTGVLCWTVSTDEEGLRKALPVGDCVSRELFPG